MSRPPVTERGWFQVLFIGGLTVVACAFAVGVFLWLR